MGKYVLIAALVVIAIGVVLAWRNRSHRGANPTGDGTEAGDGDGGDGD